MAAATAAGIEPDRIRVHVTFAGGSFGLHSTSTNDPTTEAVQVARALDWQHPIKVQSMREEEFKSGNFRAMAAHRVRAGADDAGQLIAMHHQIAAEPTSVNLPFVRDVQFRNGVDFFTTTGAVDGPYKFPAFKLESTNVQAGVPTMVWRSVGNSHTEFARECALDELALAAGRDPVELRRDLLADNPRTLRALEVAAETAGWGKTVDDGRARGVACSSFVSHSAQIVEISLDERDRIHVERIVYTLDCGTAINPDLIRAQIEGGVVFGLSAAAWGEVVLGGGGEHHHPELRSLPTCANAICAVNRGRAHRFRRATDGRRRGCRSDNSTRPRERDRGPHRHPHPSPATEQDHPHLLKGPHGRRQHHPERERPLPRLRPGAPHRHRRPRNRTPRPDGALPVRSLEQQAVLRRHPPQDRLRRHARELITMCGALRFTVLQCLHVCSTVNSARSPSRPIGFGAMRLTGPNAFGPPASRVDAIALLREAVERGVNHIDTAEYYGPDVVNELIRDALHPYPPDLVIVSKVGARRDDRGGIFADDEPAELRRGIEDNLRALDFEQLAIVNLRLMRNAGPDAFFDEQLAAMVKARDDGLIAAIGLSNVSLAHLRHALRFTEIACVQNAFHLANRASTPVLEECVRRGIAFVPFAPLGSGSSSLLHAPQVLDAASRSGCTTAQVLLAWALAVAPNIVLIPGTASFEHLSENLAAADVQLDSETLHELANAPSTPAPP